jgi:hypothetical protein
MRIEVTSQKPSLGGLTPIVWPGVFENLNGRLEFLEGKTLIFRGPSNLVDLQEG